MVGLEERHGAMVMRARSDHHDHQVARFRHGGGPDTRRCDNRRTRCKNWIQSPNNRMRRRIAPVLKREDNEKLTRTGPGTPLGQLMRSYWQPAALVSEMPEDRPVKAIRLMSEDLVLFRREDGEWGLISRFCAHRGVDLSFGRLEDGGLRCLYHGWLYDTDGRCLEQPAEPAHSTFAAKIRIGSYP